MCAANALAPVALLVCHRRRRICPGGCVFIGSSSDIWYGTVTRRLFVPPPLAPTKSLIKFKWPSKMEREVAPCRHRCRPNCLGNGNVCPYSCAPAATLIYCIYTLCICANANANPLRHTLRRGGGLVRRIHLKKRKENWLSAARRLTPLMESKIKEVKCGFGSDKNLNDKMYLEKVHKILFNYVKKIMILGKKIFF